MVQFATFPIALPRSGMIQTKQVQVAHVHARVKGRRFERRQANQAVAFASGSGMHLQ